MLDKLVAQAVQLYTGVYTQHAPSEEIKSLLCGGILPVGLLRFAGWLSGVDRSRLDEYVPKPTITRHAE